MLIMPGLFLRGRRQGKSVLQESDFTYLGYFLLPGVVAHNGTSNALQASYSDGLAHRYVGSELRLYAHYYWQNAPYQGDSDEVDKLIPVEFQTPPTPVLSNPSTITAYGSLGSNYATGDDPYVRACGMHWDESTSRLYIGGHRVYSGTGIESTLWYWTLSATQGNKSTATRSSLKYQMSAATYPTGYGTRWITQAVAMPQSFADSYCGGKRLALVGGGNRSTVSVGPCSEGPALFAAHHVDPDIDTSGVYARGLTPILFHPYHANGRVSPYRGRRPNLSDHNLVSLYGQSDDNWDYDAGDGKTYFVGTDDIRAGIVWVDTGTKHGLIYMANVQTLGTWATVAASPSPALSSGDTRLTIGIDSTAGAIVKIGDSCIVWNGVHRPDYYAGAGNAGLTASLLGISAHDPCVLGAESPQRSEAFGERGVVIEKTGNTLVIVRGDAVEVPGASVVWHAVPSVGNQVFFGESYYDAAQVIGRQQNCWLVYDPDQLALSASGSQTWHETTWTNAWYSPHGVPISQGGDGHGTTWYGYSDLRFGEAANQATVRASGATYDSATRRLYVRHRERVHVYEVAA